MNRYQMMVIIAQVFAYILSAIIIYQIIQKLLGGSWQIEEAILSLVVLNITLTFTLAGYMVGMQNRLNNKISKIDTKLHGHLEWHKGRENI